MSSKDDRGKSVPDQIQELRQLNKDYSKEFTRQMQEFDRKMKKLIGEDR